MFAETRNEAVNPLKASQAYKNIADALNEAKIHGEIANTISDEIKNKVKIDRKGILNDFEKSIHQTVKSFLGFPWRS